MKQNFQFLLSIMSAKVHDQWVVVAQIWHPSFDSFLMVPCSSAVTQ